MTATTTKPSAAAERRERNRKIAAARATGEDWTSIAYRFRVSERTARRAARSALLLAAEEEDWRARVSPNGGTSDG